MEEKRRILFYLHSRGIGGVGAALLTLLRNLDRERFQPVATVPDRGPMWDALAEIDVPRVIVESRWWIPMRAQRGDEYYYRLLDGLPERINELRRILCEQRIDLVHTDTLSCADAAIAAKLEGLPHLWHLHGTFDNDPDDSAASYLPMDLVFRIVDDTSACIAAVSQSVGEFVRRYVPDARIEIIRNGIDFDGFDRACQTKSDLLDAFPQIRGQRLVGMVGRVDPVKGVEDFLEAALEVLARRDDVAFVLVGKEEDHTVAERMRVRIRASGHEGRFVFAGFRKDVPAVLRQLDVVVNASLREGLPMSSLEAMAAGRPLVATRASGNVEVVDDGETGVLTEIGNPRQLAQAIDALLEDRDRASRMGERARRRVVDQFGAQQFGARFASLYDSLLDGWESTRPSPWGDVLVRLAGDVGRLGVKQLEHGREIRDLRSFEGIFKSNPVYRTLKKVVRRTGSSS
jgi:glycosyltransferase involved in cell wall biosynthesis